VLIDHGRRLRAAVAIHDVEIESGDAMPADGAFERGAAIHWFGCVISHIFIVVLFACPGLGNRCATFGQDNRAATTRIFANRFPKLAEHELHSRS
jgi:hypothetical protein